MEIEWMVTYQCNLGDGRFGEDRYQTFETKEEAQNYLEDGIRRETEKKWPDENTYHKLHVIIYDKETTEEAYELYKRRMSKKTQQSIEERVGIQISKNFLGYGKNYYYWSERWEYVGDLWYPTSIW